jgi:hypothetical protein
MTIRYEIIELEYDTTIRRYNEDGTFTSIPMDESNSDYQAYLNKDKPKAEQSTPIVIDEAKAK